MSTPRSPGFSGQTEEMVVSGEHLAAVEAQLASLTSVTARRRWYVAAALCAIAGGTGSALLHRSTGMAPPFIAGFAALPMLMAGFGPFLLTMWGTFLLTFVVEGPDLASSTGEQLRYVSAFALAFVAALSSEILRRNRINSIDREYRLAQALRRSEELRVERLAADERQQLERNRAAAELQARDQQIARITASIPGIVYQCVWKRTGETQYLFVSERARDVFAIDPAEMVADASVAWRRVHPDDTGGLLRSANACMDTFTPWRYEFRIADPAKPGAWRWGRRCVSPGRSPTARCSRVFSRTSPISEGSRTTCDSRSASRGLVAWPEEWRTTSTTC